MKFNVKTYLAKASAMRLAIGFGVLAELFVVGTFVLFGGFGPCGPSNDYTGLVLMFHLPGILLAEKIASESGILFIPFALASGVVTFSLFFWVIIWLWRKFPIVKKSLAE